MKTKLKVSDFSKAVKLCVNAIEPNDMLRSNMRFEAEGDKMRVKATNSSYSIEFVCPCNVLEEGTATVDGKMAYRVIAKASSECSIDSDDKNMTIKTSGRTKLPNIGKELPMIEKVTGKRVVFDSVEFKNAINKIAYAISEDQSRLILTGAHIVTNGQTGELTALDGFRLAQTIIPCDGDSIDIVVPYKILSAVCDAITDGDLVLEWNGIHISISGEGFSINAVILSGDYIDTARIIPTDFKTNVLVQTAEIKDCTDSATVASAMNNLVKLNINNDRIIISSNSESADFQGDMKAMVEGDGLIIAFNLKYLIQTLAHIDTEQCEIKLNSQTAPVIIVPHVDGRKDLHLILPVRLFG